MPCLVKLQLEGNKIHLVLGMDEKKSGVYEYD